MKASHKTVGEIAINDKNLDYEIETLLLEFTALNVISINDKNLDYEIETHGEVEWEDLDIFFDQ